MSKQVRIIIIAITVLLLSGAAAASTVNPKRVDINTGSKVVSVNTTLETVGDVLENVGITIEKDDEVQPPVDAEITENMQVFIQKAFMVNVSVDGYPKRLRTGRGTVANVKEKMEKLVDSKTKLVSGNESDSLLPEMTITLVTTYTKTEEEYNEIPFETVYQENDQLDEGTEQVVQEGENGASVSVYELLYEGKELASRTLKETKTSKPPKSKIIDKGTKVPPPVNVIQANGTQREIVKTVTMRASAYTTDRGDAGPITATGERARVGLVAVDPKFIPLGTWLYIEGYGEARAADTGGMIKGNAIDLFFNSYNECVQFGRRNITVHILK